MIITVTPNPAVDQTLFVQGFRLGEVNRFHESQLDPAGKGVNASRMVHRLGWPTIAFGFLAGEMGDIVERALDTEMVQCHFVRVSGQTRLNVTVVDSEQSKATNFYGPGPTVNSEEREQLDGLVRFWLNTGGVLVLAGSLPPGLPLDTYATYIEWANAKGVKTVLDADGEALARGIEAKPTLIKPNRVEAERLLGRELPDEDAVVSGAREIIERGVGTVVVSMGARGAVCVQGDRAWLAAPPDVKRESTVGSGDSMVAGLAIALAEGRDIAEGLRIGTAAGAATAMVRGTALGAREQVDALLPQVRVEALRSVRV